MSKFSSIWTAHIGLLGKTRVEVHITTLAILAIFCMELLVQQVSVFLVIFALFFFITSLLLHEVVHHIALAGKAQTKLLKFYSFGALRIISYQSEPADLKKDNLTIRAIYRSLIAAPLINLILGVIFLLIYQASLESYSNGVSLTLFGLAKFNLFIAAINLLPILPFDLGQLCKLNLEKKSAGDYAKFIQLASIATWLLFFYAAFSENLALTLVTSHALIVMLQEVFLSKASKTLGLSSIKDVMIDFEKIESLPQAMSIAKAADLTAKSFQSFFPIKNHDELVGFVSKDSIVQAYAGGAEDSLATITQQDFLKVEITESIIEAFKKLDEFGAKILFVFNGDRPVGLLLKDKLNDYLMIASIKSRNEDELDF